MRSFVVLLVVLVAGACAGQAPSSSRISASAATATAVAQAGSTIPVKVLSARLSTYEAAEAGGGTIVAASTPVWAVLLLGSFQPPSCGPATATPHPCPSPATSALILIDARTGAFIEGMMPAPSAAAAPTVAASLLPSPVAAPAQPASAATGSPGPTATVCDLAAAIAATPAEQALAVVRAYEQARAAGRWADAWSCLAAFSKADSAFAVWASAGDRFNAQGGATFTIAPPTLDWTVLNYAYVGDIEANIRATADVGRAYAAWVSHPGFDALSGGSEGLIVAPLLDGSGWRIWGVH